MIGLGHHAVLTMPGWNPRKLEIQFKTRVSPNELEQLKQSFPDSENLSPTVASKVKTTKSNFLLHLLSPIPETPETNQVVQLNNDAFSTLLSSRYGCSQDTAKNYTQTLKSLAKVAVFSSLVNTAIITASFLFKKHVPANVRNRLLIMQTFGASLISLSNQFLIHRAFNKVKNPQTFQKPLEQGKAL